MYGQSTKSNMITISGVYSLLISMMQLSNATKNQKDTVSCFLQSYASKIHNAIFFALIAVYGNLDITGQMLMAAIASIMAYDSVVGLQILYQVYNPTQR